MTTAHLTSAAFDALGVSGGGVEVDFDGYSVLLQFGLFIVMMLVLKPMLFDPMLKLFTERERATDGVKKKARDEDERSVQAQKKYETEMATGRAAANVEREKIRAEAMKTESELLAKVRASTARTLDEGKAKAQAEAAQVRATLKIEAQALAKDLASRVLGREVQG